MSIFVPIPKLFYSAYSGETFDRCIDCECELKSYESFYSVQKFIVAGETVFELAMCDRCRGQLYLRFSDESRATIQRFIGERRQLNIAPDSASPESETVTLDAIEMTETSTNEVPNEAPQSVNFETLDSLQACILCHAPKSQLRRYALVGLFLADEIFVMRAPPGIIPTPCLVCDACNSGLDGMLSRKTRDEWNEFVEEHFPGPPGIELDSPRQTPLMV